MIVDGVSVIIRGSLATVGLKLIGAGEVFNLKNGEGSPLDFLIRGGPVSGSSRMISQLK